MTAPGIQRRMQESVRQYDVIKDETYENIPDFLDQETGLILHLECLTKEETGM